MIHPPSTPYPPSNRASIDASTEISTSYLTTTDEAEAVANDLRESGAKVASMACDVSELAQCEAPVDQARSHFGRVDILVNNAGIRFKMKPMLEVNPATEWDKVIAVNLSGAFYCTHAARAMVDAGNGGRQTDRKLLRSEPGSNGNLFDLRERYARSLS